MPDKVRNPDDDFMDSILNPEEDESLETTLERKSGEKEVVEGEVTVGDEEIAVMEKQLERKLTDEEKQELKSQVVEEGKYEIPEDLEFIQPEKLPKELQPHFKRMFASFTKKMQSMGDAQKKAELWDYLQENPQFITDRMGVRAEPRAEKPVETKDDVVEFVNQLNLPEDNELTPAFKLLAVAVGRMAKGMEKSRETDGAARLNERINAFRALPENADLNKGPKMNLQLIRKMDELGRESPTLYNNLARLKKFAQSELGIPEKQAREENKINIFKLYKDMKEAKKFKVRKPVSGENKETKAKPAKTVKEAFNQALEQMGIT